MKGNLAPEGAGIKVAGTSIEQHEGPAKVFDGERGAFEDGTNGDIVEGDEVVIRHEGPKGGPGMQEMLVVNVRSSVAGIGDAPALIEEGRY